MSARIFLFGSSVFMLSACSSLESLLRFEQDAPAVSVPEAPVQSPAVSVPDEWCQRVAASDRLRAQQSGYDTATLDRMTLESYRQCVVLGAP